MSVKSGLFGAITTVVLILVLGNRWTVDNVAGRDPAPQATGQIIGFFGWDPDSVFGELRAATYVSLAVLVVAVFVLGGLAGRARPLAAFVGGWGAAIGAAAIASIVFALVAGDRLAFAPSGKLLDRIYLSVSSGTGAMATVGWLVGLAVLLGSFGAKQPKLVHPGASAPAPYPAAGGPVGGPAPFDAPPVGAYPSPPGTPEPFGAPASPGAPEPFGAPASPGAPEPVATPAPGPGPSAPAPPAPAAPPSSSGGPVIGTPPDRTQVQPRPPD